eukprot:176451-Amphidinium_carterae.1
MVRKHTMIATTLNTGLHVVISSSVSVAVTPVVVLSDSWHKKRVIPPLPLEPNAGHCRMLTNTAEHEVVAGSSKEAEVQVCCEQGLTLYVPEL